MSRDPSRSFSNDVIGLIVAVVACFAAAGLGGLVTTPQIPNWYADLAKPGWTPPGWIFGPVWTVLYLMMAVAAWLVWRANSPRAVRLPLIVFGVQLTLNCLWSVLFFGLQNPAAAAVEIVLLWVSIVATLILFWFRSRWAAALLVPYLLWVSFAAVLNIAIWRLNV